MSHLTLSTFGTLRVALDGTPITRFATDKVRALLVFLAVEATHPHLHLRQLRNHHHHRPRGLR